MTTATAVFQTELIKAKNTLALWLVIIGAAFVPTLFFLVYINRWERFVPPAGQNPWTLFFQTNFRTASFLFIPLFIILLCSLIVNIEHKSNAWKHLLTLPVSKGSLFLNKLLSILLLSLACYVLFMVFMLVSASLLGVFKPKLGFWNATPNLVELLKVAAKSFVSSLGVLAIHYWLSLRFKNMFVSIGIGLMCVITVTILVGRWDKTVFIPYTYTALTAMPFAAPKWNSSPYFLDYHEWFSLGYFVVLTLASYLDFTRFYKG